ncbi:hypothetical protein QH494_13310 [Sphingomonas sp. AR_OL41]|uniref:hypothetical protein n=1 Tax=Sphingomonas sp. AR_OL41 TaxID=3042729 RepID=UPI0024814B10|nr:hypothetical protein [Sphingomonas sp. AR_OL41]MDH7973161.1 hypothetical protein [Sphingomonas sp. AR_OL41]
MSDPFSDSIVAYLGYGSFSWPQSNADAIVDPLVRHRVCEVLDFAEKLEPDWSHLNLVSAGQWARERLAIQFPHLTDEALDALVWSCTFGWK